MLGRILRPKNNTDSFKLFCQQVFSLNTEKDIHVGFQSLLAEVNKAGTQYLLRSANRLFAEEACEFLSVS